MPTRAQVVFTSGPSFSSTSEARSTAALSSI
jgi:hypothetical protein